jgi:hypothetical protein
MGCALAVAGYAATLLHIPSIAAVGALVGVAATIAYVILARRAARTAPADAAKS